METSKQQTLPFGEEKSTCSQADSRARMQASLKGTAKVSKGSTEAEPDWLLKCCGQSKRSDQSLLFPKTSQPCYEQTEDETSCSASIDWPQWGYFSEWRITSASEVGAPHRRPRLYMVSYPGSIRLSEGESFFSNVLSPVRTVCRVFAGATFNVGIPWKDELPICLDDYGIPPGLVGTRTKKIKHSFHASVNAIVPQVAYRIFDAINKYNRLMEI